MTAPETLAPFTRLRPGTPSHPEVVLVCVFCGNASYGRRVGYGVRSSGWCCVRRMLAGTEQEGAHGTE